MTNDGPSQPYTARGSASDEDWGAVAVALNHRMAKLRIGQQRLSDRSGVSVTTVRALQRGSRGRRVQNPTLAAICRALDWPADHLLRVLVGDPVATDFADVSVAQEVLAAIVRIERYVEEIARVIGAS